MNTVTDPMYICKQMEVRMRTRTQDSLKQFFKVDNGYANSEYEWYIITAKTYLMMARCTRQRHYLEQAKECIDKARSLKVGFMRPLGALVNEAA